MSDDLFLNPDIPIKIKLHSTGLKIFHAYGHNVKKSVIEDLGFKKKFYQDEWYISALEKEYVGFYETTKLFVKAITHYLITGEPDIKSAEIEDFVCSARFSPSKDTVKYHLKYLYDDDKKCSVHGEHKDYNDIKWCRIHLFATKHYIKSLEKNYIEKQSIKLVARILFKIVLKYRRYFAGVCSKYSPEDISNIVKEWVIYYGFICIGKKRIPKY